MKRMKTSVTQVDSRGFTLVELMIALAMSGIIIAAVYGAYNVQNKTYHAQEKVVDMQQNIRAAMEIMTQDVRMATFGHESDPDDCTIDQATSGALRIRIDDDGDGSCDVTNLNNENIQYDLNANNLRRNNQAIAEHIEAIEFCYKLIDKPNDNCVLAPADADDIQAVQISILAKVSQRDPKFKNTKRYYPGSCFSASGVQTLPCATAWGPFDDEYRRRILVSTVNIRNRGL